MLSLRQGLTELSTQPSFPSCCVIDVAVNTVPLLLAPTVATRYSELFVLPLAFHFIFGSAAELGRYRCEV